MEKLRTRQILMYLKARKSCTLAELMQKFGVSSATIHRDVEELARRDAVSKVRGGLVWNETLPSASDSRGYQDRTVANLKAKSTAAAKALATIEEGDILFLDSSTTVYELATLLQTRDFQHLTIITNSVSIIQDFRKYPAHWVLIALGGNYDPQLNSILGARTLEELRNYNLTKAFVSAFGVDDKVATTNHERQAELLHRVIDLAKRNYLLIDKSKVGKTGLYRLSARGTFDAIFIG